MPRSRSPLTAHSSRATRATSAAAASSRGRMVSAGPSSADRSTTPAGPSKSLEVPSGIARQVETRAAMSHMTVLLPLPGSPSITVNLPSGMYPGQSQRTCSGVTSESNVIFGVHSPVSRGGGCSDAT